MKILIIEGKDFYQFLKKWQTFIFLLLMPLVFIILFGKAFGGSTADDRPLVFMLDEDGGAASSMLVAQLENDDAVWVTKFDGDAAALRQSLSNGEADAGLWIQNGLDESLSAGGDFSGVVWYAGNNAAREQTAFSEMQRITKRVNTAAVIAWASSAMPITDDAGRLSAFQQRMEKYVIYWQAVSGLQIHQTVEAANPYSQPAPGMMLQFAVAGLTGLATILVLEKSSRTEERLRMVAVPAWQVMLGHFLALALILGLQFVILLVFGQLALGLDYLASWPATLLISLVTVFCIAALGLLIGVVSKNEEQVVVFAMLAMFLLSGLGGLWMSLDVTGAAFQTIGHFTPLAWSMDGYQAILNAPVSAAKVSTPVLVLGGYTLGLLLLTMWIYQRQKVK
jgi:ABC-2 type transport system permease protein